MNFDRASGLEFGDQSTDLDPSIMRELPQGCQILGTGDHGSSFWAKTGRIDVALPDGTEVAYFIKVVSQDIGKNMVQSEFESMKAIQNVVPEFVPAPIAWGSFELIPDTHFFLCEFRDISGDMPDPVDFGALLAPLHQKSSSPNGKFGFHITTYAGNLPQFVEWEDSWEVFFTKSMRHALDLEIKKQGPDEELSRLAAELFNKVIPRLLRPLESNGKRVTPSLVHGDLWFANAGVDMSTDKPVIFDACCFYAHNEYEFGQWRPACNKFDDKYIEAYNNMMRPGSDTELEGRLDLYRLRFDTHVSALFGKENLRKQVLEVMGGLVQRFGGN